MMQIPCSEEHCAYQSYGECTLKTVTDACRMNKNCAYFRPKHKKQL